MLFEARLKQGIHDGSITVAFRRWRRAQVVAGGRYRTGLDMIQMESVDVVSPEHITTIDAGMAGYPTVAELLSDLRGNQDCPIFRLQFSRLDEPDPRDLLANEEDLSAADIENLQAQLGRLDQASRHGPWTAATLALIDHSPGVAAPRLAACLQLPTDVFKRDVRKLKALGLTISLRTGYRLSPRGAAYLSSGRSEPDGTRDEPEPR